MDPFSTTLTVVGWFISPLISRLVTKIVEDWAKCQHLDTEVEGLKHMLQRIKKLIDDAKGMTISSSPLLQSLTDQLQQKVYDADDLLDDLDYYRLHDLVEKNNNEVRPEAPKSLLRALGKQLSCRSGDSVLAVQPGSSNPFSCRSGDSVRASQPGCSNPISCHSGVNVRASQPGSSESRPRLIKKDMSDKIKNVVRELGNIYREVDKELRSRKIDEMVTAIKSTTIREAGTTSHYDVSEVVGRDKVKLDLVQLLTSESSSDEFPHVFPIVGHGGVGKTTLAQMVYNDPKVSKYFDLRMWIWVSSALDVNDLTMKMLGYISEKGNYANKSLSQLQDIIVDNLESKNVLLVVDNLWENMNIKHWRLLTVPFRNTAAKGKRIVVTTRYPAVAAQVSSIQPVNLDGLEGDDCKSLFNACAFGGNDPKSYPNLLDIGENIIEKLKGYPLEIKTVGAVLSEKLEADHWIRVRDNDEWKNFCDSNSEDHIMASLKLGYQYLSCELQQCFSTCSLFPKNFKFNGDDLISLWIAQGFIDAESVERIKQLESASLNKLVGRGFLQEVREKDENEQGTVVYYIMHDLMHDLAAMVSEEFRTIQGHGIKIGSSWSKTRHLSIITSFAYEEGSSTPNSKWISFVDELGKIVKLLEVPKLRTLILIGNYDKNFAEKFGGLFQSTKCLRAIILTTGKFHVDHLLRNISNFLHLRYLKLESGKFSDCEDKSNRSTVPQSLCWLYHLETLDVRNWENVFALPRLTHCLVNLRRFHANERQIGNISEVGRLEKLEELREFTVTRSREFNVGQLGKLNKLGGVLRISSLENIDSGEEAGKAKIMSKTQLQDLSLFWSERRLGGSPTTLDLEILRCLQPPETLSNLTISGYAGERCPGWIAETVKHLKSFHLSGCVKLKVIPPLGQLRVLEKLHLEGLRSVSEVNLEFYGSNTQTPFGRLKEVAFCKMDKFQKWCGPNYRGSIFPSLEKLKIIDCPKLSGLPSRCAEDYSYFPILKELVIENCQEIVLPPLPHTENLQYISVRYEREDPHKILLMSSRFLGQLSMSIFWNAHVTEINWDHVLVFAHLGALTELTIENCPVACLPLKGFQHLKSLKKLVLRDSERRPSGIPHSSSERLLPTSLELLEIYSKNVSGRQLSKWLLHLPSLHTLVLTSSEITCLAVGSLTNKSNLIVSRESSSLDEGLLQIFPPLLQSLRDLKINKCINLVSLILKNEGFGGFPSLQKLTITNCSKVLASPEIIKQSTEFCIFPQSLEQLEVDHITEILQSKLLCNLSNLRYLNLDWSPTVKSLVMNPLIKLEELNIATCQELSSLKGVCSLKFLKKMKIIKCPGLARALEHALDNEKHENPRFSLPLEVLIVDDVSFLREIICEHLTSLKKFVLDHADQEELSKKQKKSLGKLKSLQQIDFKNCPNLQSLPNELDKLCSLNILRIISCPKIQSVPENIALEEMHIYSCSNQLENTCENLRKVKRVISSSESEGGRLMVDTSRDN